MDGRFSRLVDGLGKVADNVWAFSLFVIAAGLAGLSHATHDDKLLTFAGTVATTGASIFSRKKD
jgi:hypothetical protein